MGDESDLIDELRAIAGVGNKDQFVIERAPHPFEVRYSSGSSSSLTFLALYDAVARADHDAIVNAGGTGAYRRSARATSIRAIRPLAITLRSETPSDVDAKLEGINVEHQTGDEKFNRAVYVSTPTTDPDVLAAVLGPNVRQGVLALLVLGFSHVKIDAAGQVEAHLSQFTERAARPGRGAQAVEAFALVLSDLPALEAAGGAHPEPPMWAHPAALTLLIIAVSVVGVPASCGIAEATRCTQSSTDADGETSTTFRDGCGGPAFLALIVSVFVAFGAAVLARAFATPRLRGRSDSSSRILRVRITAFLLTLVVTYFVTSGLAFTYLRR